MAPQDKKIGLPGIPPSEPGTIREARSGKVRDAGREEEESGEGRDGGMVDTPFTK